MCNQYAWIFPKERSFAEMPSSSRSGETLKELRAMETYKQQKNVTNSFVSVHQQC